MQKVRTGNDRKSEWIVNSWKASLLVHGYWSLWNSAASSLIYLPHMHCVSHQHLFNREIFLRFIFTACVMAWSRRRGSFAHWGPLLPFSHWTVLTDWSWNCQGFTYITYVSFSWRGKHPFTRRPLNAMEGESLCRNCMSICKFSKLKLCVHLLAPFYSSCRMWVREDFAKYGAWSVERESIHGMYFKPAQRTSCFIKR